MRYLQSHVRSFGRFAEPFTLPLERLGLVLVEGENLDNGGAFDSNGASKSLLFEGIFSWNTFGKMPRYDDARLGAAEVCIDGREADIANDFETSRGRFRVRRRRRSTGSPVLTIQAWDAAARDFVALPNVSADPLLAEGDLTGLLGYDYAVSRNALFLQGSSLSAASETFAKQMVMLESLLRFDDFTRGAKLAKQRTDAFDLEARQIVDLIDQQSTIVLNATNTLRDLEGLDESIRERELTTEIAVIVREYTKLPSAERIAAKAAHRFSLLRDLTESSRAVLAHVEEHIETVSKIDGACPTCEREMQKRSADALIKRLRAQASVLETQIQGNEKARDAAKAKLDAAEDDVARLGYLPRERSQLQRELDDLTTRKSRRLALVQTQTERRVTAESEVVRLTAQSADARRQTQIGKYGKASLDGLKPEVFALGSPVFDAEALRYSRILCDDAIRVSLNPERDGLGSILRITGASAPTYKGCSAGERRRIALVTAFASRALARWRAGGERVNVAVWDEIFDPLDESGVRRAVQVLEQDIQELETVFVISHSTTLKQLFPGARTMRVIRENGIARLECDFMNRISAPRPRRSAV